MQTTELVNNRPIIIQWTKVELLEQGFEGNSDFERWLLCGADEAGTIYDAEGEFYNGYLRSVNQLQINN